ncbi:hypothetical protein SAMN05216235_0020 [Salinicoccus halodurans]|uniref:GIY-YIG domain-containing protein n=2 Tax=Salinicoccus halodurans TaxID=407035 RepID=A0A0F7HK03_9STAP|nr:hypothetical protein [Salinicoccus halodurans]AKG73436.1 hypothetical protein AAT16_03925 [Salinicoccus halodurans]SFK50509.1 hypothetical protein SAMN05216235_0020 [Salinicoccus halodurans]
MITDNQKPPIEDMLTGLTGKIQNVWESVEVAAFEVSIINVDGTRAANLTKLREEMKKRYGVKRHGCIRGIYMIYVYNTNLKGGEKKLFYIGESRKSVFSRLKRHFSKVEKQKIEGAPARYKSFSNLFDEGMKIEVKILRLKTEENLLYRRLLEEILTLSEKPKYIDDLNNNLVKRNPVEL